MKRSLQTILTCLWFAVAAQATAAVVVIDGGPAWGTGPVDTTNTAAGSMLNGGQVHNYTNAEASAGVDAVYFGLWSGGSWGFSGNGAGITGSEIYHWHADTATSIEYRGQTTVPTVNGAYQIYTRLVLTALTGATVVSDAVTQGLSGDVHSLFMLTGGTFSVRREVELSSDGITWADALPYYNSLQFKVAGNTTQSSVSTGFYWQNEATGPANLPEPGALGLAAAGLLALGVLRRGRHAS